MLINIQYCCMFQGISCGWISGYNRQKIFIPASGISLARYLLILCTCIRILSFAGSVNYPEDFSSPSSLSSQHQLCSPTAPIPVHRAPLSPMDPVQYRSDSRRSSTSSVSSVGKPAGEYITRGVILGVDL